MKTIPGSIRGAYLTIKNTAVILAPLLISFILTNREYWKIYLISSIFILPVFIISSKNFSNFKDLDFLHIKAKDIIYLFLNNKDLYKIFMTQLIMNIFLAFMVIYVPIYLHEIIGFDWASLGIIFTIMLLPFLIFQIPLGKIADLWLGEKEIMVTGIIITVLSTISISFIKEPMFLLWAGILFMTRVGLSFVEVAIESYFFKHVNENNADEISFFRITNPLAFIISPTIAIVSLIFIDLQYLFIIPSIILIIGLKYALTIKDTK